MFSIAPPIVSTDNTQLKKLLKVFSEEHSYIYFALTSTFWHHDLPPNIRVRHFGKFNFSKYGRLTPSFNTRFENFALTVTANVSHSAWSA
jgi:hypothetical protein